MAIFKKLNDNHQNISDDELWTKSKYNYIVENGFTDYTRLNLKFFAKSVYENISSEDEINELLTRLWRPKLDKTFDVLVLHNNEVNAEIWHDKQLEIWQTLQSRDLDDEYKNRWLFIFDIAANIIFTPNLSENGSNSLTSRLNPKNYSRNRFERQLKNSKYAQHILQNIFNRDIDLPNEEVIIKQLKKSDKSVEKWKSRLKKRNYWDEDEEIIQAGSMHVTRSNWKVRSNLTRRGRFLITNKRMIYVRRKFAFFGFGALIPLFVFVRPSNKLLLFFQTIFQIIKVPLQLFKAIKPGISAMGPVAIGFAFSFSFIDFSELKEFWTSLSSLIPGLDFIGLGVGWVIENPEVIPVIAGFWVLINNLLRLLFMRGEELIILPYNQLSTLFLDGSMLVGRWKVKGVSTVRAPENGLEYKMRIQDLNRESEYGSDRNLVLANKAFNFLITNDAEDEIILESNNVHSRNK